MRSLLRLWLRVRQNPTASSLARAVRRRTLPPSASASASAPIPQLRLTTGEPGAVWEAEVNAKEGTVVEAAVPFVFYGTGERSRARGFTLTELVAVMLIVAILAVTATSVFDRRTFDTAAFADQTFAQLAYAQKVAVAARRNVTVSVSGNTISLAMCTDAACTSTVPVPSPQGEASFSRTAPAGITVASSNASFGFTALGGLNVGANVTLTVTGDVARNLTVESVTGYVHACSRPPRSRLHFAGALAPHHRAGDRAGRRRARDQHRDRRQRRSAAFEAGDGCRGIDDGGSAAAALHRPGHGAFAQGPDHPRELRRRAGLQRLRYDRYLCDRQQRYPDPRPRGLQPRSDGSPDRARLRARRGLAARDGDGDRPTDYLCARRLQAQLSVMRAASRSSSWWSCSACSASLRRPPRSRCAIRCAVMWTRRGGRS